MNWRLVIISAAAIVIVAAAVGCGSDETGNAAEGDAPSKAEFVKQVGAACQKARKGALDEIRVYEEKHSSEELTPGMLGARAIKVVLLRTIKEEIDAIRQAGMPEGGEAEIEAILTALDADYAVAKTKDEISPIEGAFATSSKQLTSYGLEECAK